MKSDDLADSHRLAEAITRILPALSDFYKFEGPDRTALLSDQWKNDLTVPLPRCGAGLDAVLDELIKTVIPNGLRNGHPGFSGWVTTSPTSSGAVAALASSIAGSQRVWVQAFNHLEVVSLNWIKELLGLPSHWHGTYTGGGASANLIGLGAARQSAVEKLGVDPSMDGLPHGVDWRIYASSEVHHVINRAAAILGIGRKSVSAVPTNKFHQMDIRALKKVLHSDATKGIRPLAIVATAGTVNTGAIDPINDIADLAEEFGAWLHVDGAYGLWGKLDDRVAHLYKGIERAESVVVDPHKWLAAPLGNGVTFVHDRSIAGRAFTLEPAAYLEGSAGDEGVLNSPFDNFGEIYHEFGVDQSAPSRGVTVWAILKEIGADGMRDRVIRHNTFARLLANLAHEDPKLEVISEPVLSICCFRYNDNVSSDEKLNRLNTRIAAALRAESNYLPSTTIVDGIYTIRPCYINPRNRREDVEGLVKRVRELGDEMS